MSATCKLNLVSPCQQNMLTTACLVLTEVALRCWAGSEVAVNVFLAVGSCFDPASRHQVLLITKSPVLAGPGLDPTGCVSFRTLVGAIVACLAVAADWPS